MSPRLILCVTGDLTARDFGISEDAAMALASAHIVLVDQRDLDLVMQWTLRPEFGGHVPQDVIDRLTQAAGYRPPVVDFPAAGAGDREGNTMSETNEDYDAAAGTDAQDDNAAAEAQAGAATDEDSE